MKAWINVGFAWACIMSLTLGVARAHAAAPALEIVLGQDGKATLSWDQTSADLVLESTPRLGAGAGWTVVPQTPVVDGMGRRLTVPPSDAPRFFRLKGASAPTRVVETSPAYREGNVAVTRETVLRLDGSITLVPGIGAPPVVVRAGGRELIGRTALSADGRVLTWFPLEPMPAAARVRFQVDGSLLRDGQGRAVDADGDGVEGGVGWLEFDTLATMPLGTTGVEGFVLASGKGSDGKDVPLAGVTITVDGSEESLRAVTDDTGFFRLSPAPAGRFFVHVDGRTAQASSWPGGAYYPVVGKAWEAEAGRTNNLAGGNGVVYLPLIPAQALKTVSAVETTVVEFVPEVVAANPALAGVEVRIPPGALVSETGARGGRVGIAPVAPDRLPEPLPPGLQLPLVITIQTDGPQNFDQPVPVRFPNLPDPVTGEVLPPGAKTVLWSFNHDTGRWEPQGTMTITADGRFAETDPGVGVRQPGWHGGMPGSPGGGPGPHPCETCDDDPDDDDDDDIPPDDPWKRCKSEVIGAATGIADCLVGLMGGEAPSLSSPKAGCGFGLGTGGVGVVRDCVLDSGNCVPTVVNGAVGVGIGCSEFLLEKSGRAAARLGPIAKIMGIMHGCAMGAGLNTCAAIDCMEPGSGAACVPDEYEDELFQWTNDAWEFLNPFDGQALHGVGPRVSLAAVPNPPEPEPELFEEARTRPYLAHARLHLALRGFYDTLYGSPLWMGADTATPYAGVDLLAAVTGALTEDSPGGATVTAEERAAMSGLSLPPGATAADLDRLISRLSRFVAATIDAKELRLRALLNYMLKVAQMTKVYETVGWNHPMDGFRETLVKLVAGWQSYCRPPLTGGPLAATAGGGSGGGGGGGGSGGGGGTAGVVAGPNGVPGGAPRALTWYLHNFDAGFSQRGEMQTGEPLPQLILAPNQFYGLFFLDRRAGKVAVSWFRSKPAGQRTEIPCALWLEGGAESLLQDSDADGLPDVAELAAGTDPRLGDTDGDGIPDAAELVAGSNPTNVSLTPSGPIAAVDTPGLARDVVITQGHALLATDSGGIATVRVSDPDRPIIAGTVPTPQPALSIASEGTVAAVALGDGGVWVLDVSDPSAPRVTFPIPMPDVLAVAVEGGRVIVGSGSDLVVVDAATGATVGRYADFGGRAIQAVEVDGDWLYVLTGADLLTSRLEGGLPFLTSRQPFAGGVAPLEFGRKLLVTPGRLYAGSFEGYSIFDRTSPGLPVLRGKPPATQAGIHDFMAAGPRLLAPVTSFGGAVSLALSLYDVSDASDVTRFIGSLDTPGTARAAAMHRGLAFVADGLTGLTVVNLVARGPDTVPPSIAWTERWALPNPKAEPLEALRVPVEADDNVLVREVALWVDDVLVDRDGGYPFVLKARAPARVAGRSGFVLQTVATDLNGLSRTSSPVVVTWVADSTPPRVESAFPPGGASVARGSANRVEVTLSEVPGALPDAVLKVFSPGADRTLGTADDVLVPGSRVSLEGRVLRWSVPDALAAGSYRAELSAGVTDSAGNARPDALAWIFTVANGQAVLRSVNPNGLLPTFDTTLSNLVATFSLALPASQAAQVTYALAGAGPDGAWGTADDLRIGVQGQSANAASLNLTTAQPLGVGAYRLSASGPGLTATTVGFALLDPRSLWAVDRSGAWGTAGNWTRAPGEASEVIISRPLAEVTVTNSASTPMLRSIVCDEGFVHRVGDLMVSDEAVFSGPFHWGGDSRTFDDATLASGVFRFRGELNVLSTTTGNRRARIGAATIYNENVMRWTSGDVDVAGADSVLVNAEGALFEIGGTARQWVGDIPSVAPGRLSNLGVIRKTGTNTVEIQAARVENSGRLEIDGGRMQVLSYRGAGEVMVSAGATMDFAVRTEVLPAGRVGGDGTVILGSTFYTLRDSIRIQGAWEVTGLTRVMGPGARFARGFDSEGPFQIEGDFALDSDSRIRSVTVIHAANRTNVLNGNLVVDELTWVRGTTVGRGDLEVRGGMHVASGVLAGPGELRISGRLDADGNGLPESGTLSISNRLVRLVGTTLGGSNRMSLRPLSRLDAGGVGEGTVVKTGRGEFLMGIVLTNTGLIRIDEGTFRVSAGGLPDFSGLYEGELRMMPGSEVRLAGGTLAFDRATTFSAQGHGTLSGHGLVELVRGSPYTLSTRGEFKPGLPGGGGSLTFTNASFGLLSTARTTFEIGAQGTAVVNGTVQLGGTLVLRVLPGVGVAAGDEWVLFTNARSTFGAVETEGVPAGVRLAVDSSGGRVIARAVAASAASPP